MRNARQKLQVTHSPIFGAFYSLVITNTVVSVIRYLNKISFKQVLGLQFQQQIKRKFKRDSQRKGDTRKC